MADRQLLRQPACRMARQLLRIVEPYHAVLRSGGMLGLVRRNHVDYDGQNQTLDARRTLSFTDIQKPRSFERGFLFHIC